MTWTQKYEGAPWVYDDDTGDIIGVRDPDGSTHFFVLGNGGKAANSIRFDTNPDVSLPLNIGEMRWNTVDQTVDLELPNGVTLQIGQELNKLFRNSTNDPILNGSVVYVTGSTGVFPTIALAQANSEMASSIIIGVTTQNIGKNIQGFVTTYGLVRDLDTSSLDEGKAVWLSPTVAGGMTTTKPSAPNHLVLVGYCIRSHPNLGSIYVKPQNGYELEELHNVKITNPQDGQVLKYSASLGLWINSNP
jgi:hypothetical protein